MAETLVWHYLRKWAEHKPDDEALVYGDRRVTFGEFLERTQRMAKLLLELGVERGDRVAMLSPARDEYAYVYLATGMVGGIWYGLNPRFTLTELRHMLGDAKPRVAVILRQFMNRDYADDFQILLDEMPFLEKLLVIGEPFGDDTLEFQAEIDKQRPELDEALEKRHASVDPDDGALIVYTSGTTGKPKGVLLSHRNIISNIEVQVDRFFLDESSTALVHFPINHAACSTEITVGAFVCGGRLIFMDKFDPRETLSICEREKITMLGQIPTMFLLEFNVPDFDSFDLSSIQSYVCSGSGAPEQLVRRLASTGATLFTGYGMTETAGFVTYTGPDDSVDDLVKTVGVIDPAFELRIVDKDRNSVAMGEIGEIAISGDCVMQRYWNMDETTAEAIDKDGWLYTGDMGSVDARGYLFLKGRSKEMYKSGGENIYPREIEEVIESHPDVLLVAVMAVPHDIYQMVGKAFVMPRPGAEISDEELEKLCRENLANYKIPKSFEIRPMLPMLANGKINRMALLEQEKARVA
ncbi:MAG: AMP-binding protein [Deltaproteobacteria bacterium]|nr:AMP-binding protein [Deltaproteobacteria bacterium]